MPHHDLLQRFIFDKVPVRGEFIHLQDSYQTIVEQHAYPQPLKRVLGEALCAAGLLSAIIKFQGRLTVQFKGKGDLRLLVAQCDNDFNIRGLVKWESKEEPTDDTVKQAMSDGLLVIMLDTENKQNVYQGIVNWRGDSLTASLEGYFEESEQLATRIWLSVNTKQASGLLLQILPGSHKDQMSLESATLDPRWAPITKAMDSFDKHALLTENLDLILQNVYPNEDIRLFDPRPVNFKCTCSRERSSEAIYLLGKEEAEAELKANRYIVVTCEFCNKKYEYDKVDVAKIFRDHEQVEKPH